MTLTPQEFWWAALVILLIAIVLAHLVSDVARMISEVRIAKHTGKTPWEEEDKDADAAS